MVSVCTVPARGGRSCEHFGGYKTINRIPLPLGFNHTISLLLPKPNMIQMIWTWNLFIINCMPYKGHFLLVIQ